MLTATTTTTKTATKNLSRYLAKKCIKKVKSRIENPKAKKILNNPDMYESRIHIDTPYAISFSMTREGDTTDYTVVAVPRSYEYVQIHMSIKEHPIDATFTDPDNNQRTSMHWVEDMGGFERILNHDEFLCNGEQLDSCWSSEDEESSSSSDQEEET
jgi:predicted small secreted protein